ncbi:MAG: 50S ribosomal protein L23 [Planctomycetota bacterium]
MSTLDRSYQIIKKPHVTEKTADDMGTRNAYTFRVPIDANKVEIRQAVEQLFKVKVLAVNTLRAPRKAKRRGWAVGMTPAWKKAMVTLAEGQSIDVL